ncbi:MAG: universal stress protein [SAR202 cluster bacterium]|nr:universal stress protein [SAR202 cluster bacterium]
MKILITLDGTQFAEAALAPACRLMDGRGTEVHLLQVIEDSRPLVSSTRSWEPPGRDPIIFRSNFGDMESAPTYRVQDPELNRQVDERLDQEAQEYLGGVCAKLNSDNVITKVIRSDKVEDAIKDYATEQGFDFIFMATHARTGLPGLFIGRVASDLLRNLDIPLVLVRPRDK